MDVSSKVDANGNRIFHPKILKFKSPGSRPKPIRSSHGNSEDSSISAMKMTKSHRNTGN